MTVAFLALGAGAAVWVRNVMPKVEITEERKPLASPRPDREAFAEAFEEGTEAIQFVKRPLIRRTPLPASTAPAVPPVLLLPSLRPPPRTPPPPTARNDPSRLGVLPTTPPLQ